MDNLKEIAGKFLPVEEIEEINSICSGLINNTYFVKTKAGSPDYILQRKNKNVFPNVPAMMDNILKVTEHIKGKVTLSGGDPEREAMTVVKSKEDEPYYKDESGEYWTMSLYIPDTISYESAATNELARKGGEGIGKFQRQLEDFAQPLYPTIEGFHDLKFRFKQWDKVLKSGNRERIDECQKEIEWIEQRRGKMEDFWHLVEEGKIPKRVTHNDTKLSNILFDKQGKVLCVIDLDTVMSNTILADFGDAIRTFANTGKEDDENLDNVELDIEKYNSYKEGYLTEAGEMLNETEKEYLSFGPQYITYEQVMRFLMDYLQNDIYYKIDYPEHNLVRTRAQMKLVESMENYFSK
ncbi:MAG: aminoglycoside phosphotransferase family protein [Muribaculaceae bacterium]|nr:aminoglycoside phosphotransferase family protein [Muribaculaceae bacterium]